MAFDAAKFVQRGLRCGRRHDETEGPEEVLHGGPCVPGGIRAERRSVWVGGCVDRHPHGGEADAGHGACPTDRHATDREALRVGLYARVSTHDQKTLPLQLSAMRDYAKKRNWTIAIEVQDVASGATPRPQRGRVR